MKKGVAIAFVCLSIFLLISMPLVSAGWFDDFWAKITGQAVAHTCNDQGNNLMIKERCINPLSEGGITLWDRCSGTNVQQASCVAGDLEDVCEYAIAQSCPTNYECFDGACVEVIAVCGDGIIEVDEECDGINLGEYTSDCETYPGYTGGTLRCSTDCLFDTLKCRGYNPPISICLDTDEINNLKARLAELEVK